MGDDVVAAGWPGYDANETAGDDAEYPVQVNGKYRAKLVLPLSLAGAELEAAVRAHPAFIEAVAGKTLKKLAA